MPIDPSKFMLYWAGTLGVLLFLIFRPRRPRGMRLRLTGGAKSRGAVVPTSADPVVPAAPARAPRERPLNVIFNYNGHSWDAYEVLGLAAGSNLDSVRAAYVEALDGVDQTSRPFIEAAYRAIVTEWEKAA